MSQLSLSFTTLTGGSSTMATQQRSIRAHTWSGCTKDAASTCACSGTRFVPKAEERLLAVVHALLHRCYKMPFSNNAEVPASLKKELSGVGPPTLPNPCCLSKP